MKMPRNKKTKEKILNFLLDNPEEKFYLTQIAMGTATPDSTAQHVLDNQIDQEFLIKEKVGNLSYYRLNLDSPLVRQAKITQTLKEITSLIKKLKEVSQKIVLFGSCALGQDTSESDIDLFVLSGERELVRKTINQAKRRRIGAVIKNYPDWVALEKENEYLYDQINKGITVWEKKYE